MTVQRLVRIMVTACIVLVAAATCAVASAEPPLRTPKKWGIETTLPSPTTIDPYAFTFHQVEGWVRDRPLWQKNDLLVTLLHDDEYLTIVSNKLASVTPGAMFYVGPAGFAGGTMFALRVPF